jgi:hypothetical protein
MDKVVFTVTSHLPDPADPSTQVRLFGSSSSPALSDVTVVKSVASPLGTSEITGTLTPPQAVVQIPQSKLTLLCNQLNGTARVTVTLTYQPVGPQLLVTNFKSEVHSFSALSLPPDLAAGLEGLNE